MEVAPQYGATFMNILRYKAAAQKCGVSVITIRRWALQPEYEEMNFPKPIFLGENSVGFAEQEIDDFLTQRAAKRDSAA